MIFLRVAEVMFNINERETEADLRSADLSPPSLSSRDVLCVGICARDEVISPRPGGGSRGAEPLSRCHDVSAERNRGLRFHFAEGPTEAWGSPWRSSWWLLTPLTRVMARPTVLCLHLREGGGLCIGSCGRQGLEMPRARARAGSRRREGLPAWRQGGAS